MEGRGRRRPRNVSSLRGRQSLRAHDKARQSLCRKRLVLCQRKALSFPAVSARTDTTKRMYGPLQWRASPRSRTSSNPSCSRTACCALVAAGFRVNSGLEILGIVF